MTIYRQHRRKSRPSASHWYQHIRQRLPSWESNEM